MYVCLEGNLKTTGKNSETLRQTADNRVPTLAINICSILEAKLKTTKNNGETLGRIADNRDQTLCITIRSILQVNLKTTSKKQRNFVTKSRQ